MRTIKESLEYDNIICESLFEKHMKKIVDQLVKCGHKPKELFEKCGFMVDKIDASRVRVIYDPEESMNKIVKAMEDPYNVVFAIKNDLVCCAWFSGVRNGWSFLPTKPEHKDSQFDSYVSRRDSPLYKYYDSGRSVKSEARMLEHADEVWIVNAKGSLHKKTLQDERYQAKRDMWENTPEYYAKVLKQNLERYRRKIHLLRMEKGSLFEGLVKEVEDFIPKVTELLLDMHRNIGLGKWGSHYPISEKISDLNRIATNFFYSLNRIVQNKRSHDEWNRPGLSASNYNLREYNDEMDQLREQIKTAKEKYNEIKDKIKEFESKHN
jgi:hypothetical protein